MHNVMVFGDAILDGYLTTTCHRISPESPTPILKVGEQTYRLGGAANAAAGLAMMGSQTALFALVGCCDRMKPFQQALATHGIDDQTLAMQATMPFKQRIVAQNQQICRLDEEAPWSNSAPRLLSDKAIQALRADRYDAVLVSDYHKGVCHQVQDVIQTALSKNLPVFVDSKVPDLARYCGCTVLKVNLKEFQALKGDQATHDLSEMAAWAQVQLRTYQIMTLVITLGADGYLEVCADGHVAHHPAQKVDVYDVSGAGDTFIATALARYLDEKNIKTAFHDANRAAAIAVSRFGTSVVSRKDLDQDAHDRPSTWVQIQHAKAQGKKIVFTNGCFDLLHPGHLQTLSQARAMGDYLIVGLNSDASVQRLKGPARPIQNQMHRQTMLNGLQVVDAVIVFEEDTPLKLIQSLCPDVLVKGGDYAIEQIVGASWVQSYGGRVETIDLVENQSTSQLVQRCHQQTESLAHTN